MAAPQHARGTRTQVDLGAALPPSQVLRLLLTLRMSSRPP